MTTTKQGEVKEQKTPVITKAQEAERIRQEKMMRKQAEMELNDYKKRLRAGNELKRLQVEELELNILYYHNKKEWLDLGPALEVLEKRERKIIADEREKEKKEREEFAKKMKEAKQKEEEEKPKIVVPKMGKARE